MPCRVSEHQQQAHLVFPAPLGQAAGSYVLISIKRKPDSRLLSRRPGERRDPYAVALIVEKEK